MDARWVLPMMTYTGRVPFFRLQVYGRVGIVHVEVYERVGKPVILVCERAQRAKQMNFIAL